MKHLIKALAGVALVAVATPAMAQETAPRAQRAQAPASEAQFVERRMQALRAADTNNDGQVSAEERRAYAQSRQAERLEARFARLDTNGDGQISREEFAAGDHQKSRMQHTRRAGRGGEARVVVLAEAEQKARADFARLDANNDGQVTAQERRAAFETAREARREQRQMRRARQASPSAAVSE